MDPTILAVCITAGASVLCQIIISHTGKKAALVEQAKKDQALQDRLNAIEEKIDIHNGYAEKLGDISTALQLLQKDVQYLREAGR